MQRSKGKLGNTPQDRKGKETMARNGTDIQGIKN